MMTNEERIYQGRVELQPKQGQLLNLLEQRGGEAATVLGLGGSRGSSKSAACRRAAIILAGSYPGIVVYIVRRVLGDVLENHMEKVVLEFPWIHQYYRPADYEYDLPNGSRIVYVYAENPVDVKRVSYGPECTFLFIDQAEQFSEDELLSFRICNRWPAMPKGFPKTCFFFNVGVGVGAGYLRRIFHLRQFRVNEEPKDYQFIQAYGWDNYEWFRGEMEMTANEFYSLSSEDRFNLFISETTEGKKMNSLPPHRRQGELLGNFDSFGGQFFSEVWGEHAVLRREQIRGIVQPWWVRWMSQDWGYGDADAHYWFVTGKLSPSDWERHFGGRCEWPMDIVIAYRELVQTGRAEADLAMDIVNLTPPDERREIKDFFLSADAFGQRAKQRGANTVGEAFSEIMHRHGLPRPSAALQQRVMGWRFMYNCLRQAQLRGSNIDEERAKQGPALFISAECPAAMENIPLAPRDEDDHEDILRQAGAIWEDVCVAAGTFIQTEEGNKRIEEIREGEEVWTRKGVRKVVWAGRTGRWVETVEVETTEGSLICTPGHRIWAEGRWVRAEELKDGAQLWNMGGSNTTGTTRDIGGLGTAGQVFYYSTERYGDGSEGRFRRDTTSTIGMEIAETMPSGIWNASLPASIWQSIRGRDGRVCVVRNAVGNTRGIQGKIDTVRRDAGIGVSGSIGGRNTCGSVSDVENNIMRKGARGEDSAGSVAVYVTGLSMAGRRDVYNLEVEGEHEYFANGILVHNCDSLRYGLFSKLGPRKVAPLEVRVKQVCQSTWDPHERAMRMLHFQERERRRRVVGRSPRWR